MLFNSYEFIFILLPVTFFIYFYLNRKRLTIASKVFLIFSSLFFYSWWNIAYLPLILASIFFNYAMGNSLSKITKSNSKKFHKKYTLSFGVFANLALLGYFKYADFFIENINLVTSTSLGALNLTLPLAISFFTFQQIAYLIDSYKQETKEYSLLNYVIFVSFFPQLIAGPIVHHQEMMPQFGDIKNKAINYKNIALGLFIFSIGLFKKVVIADTFAIWANIGFDVAPTLNLFEAWFASLSYTFQLYFDFSGYTDMAVGAALLFNITLPINFNSPYKALDIQDFWKRWHVTLSRFLKDYVYIPLGGNRKNRFRTYSNIMITFLIGGIWHGAGWLFIFWGFLHGLALVVHRFWRNSGFRLWGWLGWLLTFNFVNIAWIFFRAKEWKDAVKVLQGIFGFGGIKLPNQLAHQLQYLNQYGVEFEGWISNIDIDGGKILLPWLFAAFALIILFKNSTQKLGSFQQNYKTIVLTTITLVIGILYLNKVTEFLYFNF